MSTALSMNTLLTANQQAISSNGMLGFCQAQRSLFNQYAARCFSYADFAYRTNRATRPLTTSYDLLCYNALYAARHYSLLEEQMQCFNIDDTDTSLTIIDYGSGQGLATQCLLEKYKHAALNITVHLIDLSETALFAAKHYIKALNNTNHNITIHSHCQNIESIDISQLVSPDQLTVHLFSNILDIADRSYSMQTLKQQLSALDNEHIILAASPEYGATNRMFNELDNTVKVSYSNREVQQLSLSQAAPYDKGYFSCTGRALPANIKSRALNIHITA